VLFSSVLLALVVLHVAAVVYHHARGEKLLARMWFGPRKEAISGIQPATSAGSKS
jgi:cytochrome b